jgi:predicted ATPase
LNIADAQITGQSILSSNASNLADVLHTLLNSNRGRFDRFVGYVSEIFPEITDVLTPSNNNPGMVQVQVSIAPRDAERGDLSFSLRDCGTGVSQVLSILYVAIFDTAPRLIVIDEPNSFLHPGAAKQLIRVLKRFPQHQFIVSTRECPELC